MNEFVVYNCKDILIGFGPFSLTGYGTDDAFLTIEDMAEEAQPTSGCDSAVTVSLDPNPCSKVTITNLYGVKANKILNNLAQRLRGGELQIFPFLIKKRNGSFFFPQKKRGWQRPQTAISDEKRGTGSGFFTPQIRKGVVYSAVQLQQTNRRKRNGTKRNEIFNLSFWRVYGSKPFGRACGTAAAGSGGACPVAVGSEAELGR